MNQDVSPNTQCCRIADIPKLITLVEPNNASARKWTEMLNGFQCVSWTIMQQHGPCYEIGRSDDCDHNYEYAERNLDV